VIIASGKQIRVRRGVLLGWEQIELAKRSRVAIGTIRRMESLVQKRASRNLPGLGMTSCKAPIKPQPHRCRKRCAFVRINPAKLPGGP
jgi:hypothetical protein